MVRGLALALAACLLAVPPAVAADREADRESLKAAIDDIVRQTALAHARVGVQVISLEDGSVIYSRNPNDLLNPASNVKLFTAAAALARLGPEYRFETELLADKQPDDPRRPARPGEYRGNLYVRGTGDPSMTTARLWTIANDLHLLGVRSFSGDLVLDDSFFDGQRVGPGFDQENSDRAYMAPTGALSLNWNAVGVYVRPGVGIGKPAVVELDPGSDFFVIDNRIQTVRARAMRRVNISSVAAGDKQRIVVSGRIPVNSRPFAVWKKIDAPAEYFGHTFKKMLASRGIRVRGKVRAGTVPEGAETVYLHQSDTLDLILKRLNKNSSNFVAEQLVKALGAQYAGPPGSWAKGIAAIEQFLAVEVGIPAGTFVMKNGSGLNDTNRFSADQICQVLMHMWRRFPLTPEYLSSLGIAGKDGTLHARMEGTEAVGRLRAKTGTLENVSALAGYVEALGGERFAFAIVANDFPGRTGPVVRAIDAVGVAIAGYGTPGGPSAGAVQAMGQPPLVGPLADLKARVTTYDRLGRLHDARNLTFLRTALKSERDPALRAVVAEAIYRSDPGDAGGARLLLENFDTGPEVFGRLRQIGRGEAGRIPVLESLAAVAAEGNQEAMALLLEVAAAAGEDEGLQAQLLEPMAEVARSAPEELIATLGAVGEATQEAALELLGRSLAQSEEADHPFDAAVRRSLKSRDPQVAQLAKRLGEVLSVRDGVASEADLAASPSVLPAVAPAPGAKGTELRPGG
jgi:D-alanyl-D-alanine carboxypeptidase/D-alanyl-D-alanine-endopeptidase (penicillin-binding protein 4)